MTLMALPTGYRLPPFAFLSWHRDDLRGAPIRFAKCRWKPACNHFWNAGPAVEPTEADARA
jgi:hypothetical protein